MQLAQQVISTREDKTTSQEQPQIQPLTERQPDQPVTMAYTTTACQILQTLEMAPHDDAFKQVIEINRETSFVEAATGSYNDQSGTKIENQINELTRGLISGV